MFSVLPGSSREIGCSNSEQGINFCVYSPDAMSVLLCLFDSSGHSEIAQIEMHKAEGGLWSCLVSPLEDGCLYGYRVDGPYEPTKGHLFNKNKLLLDPYAKDIFGEFTWSERHFCHMPVGTISHLNNAIDMPKSRVKILSKYSGKRPNIPWSDVVIYECHVKGATYRNTQVPSNLRGKFLGLSSPAFIRHLKSMGINTLELLPVHSFISEQFLTTKGLRNYWGYNSLNFFTPHSSYLCSNDIAEFQKMVEQLHDANIEIILDVVYNHTAEAGIDGPMLSLKGLSNLDYYKTVQNEPSHYINDTGCGNTLNLNSPCALKLVLDSLRYWVEVMGVDGFRFDLATILGRGVDGFNTIHPFFHAINQDPILNKVKLIAEPWDIGPGGYQLGAFPSPWREWNDKYRDTVRKFWRGDEGTIPELAKRIHGSNECFEHNQRGPLNSINFITSHDGFTLADWVSYECKHNVANGESNCDGHSENLSFNCGYEGFTTDRIIAAKRLKMQKNALLTLFLSKGVPMISSGSEFGHSQGGNNNAYCQDNRTNWLPWKRSQFDHELIAFIKTLNNIRNSLSIFKHLFYVHIDNPRFCVHWLNQDGLPMKEEDWHDNNRKWLMYSLCDKHLQQSVLIILNAQKQAIKLNIPKATFSSQWTLMLSSEEISQEINNLITIPAQSSCVWTSINIGVEND